MLDFRGIATPTKLPPLLDIQFTPSPTIIPTVFDPPTVTPSPIPFTATPEACLPEKGMIEKRELSSAWLPNPMKYRVYTPPCYAEEPARRYPVLYLIHGYGYNDDQWDRLGMDEVADEMIAAGNIHPLIIVMPYDDNHNIQPPENQFGEALVNDLISTIDADYRTLPEREYRAIGGLSRGGNWAIYLGLTHWELFNAIGGHSSPLFVNQGPPNVRKWLAEIPPQSYPRVYLDTGRSDKWVTNFLGLADILNDFDVPHELYMFPGSHTEEYWGAHIALYLRWYSLTW